MTAPETLSPREVAARQLAESLRIRLGPNALHNIRADVPIRLSASEAADAVNIVTASLGIPGESVDASALAEVTAERDHLANKVALAVEEAARRSETLYAARDRTPSDLRERRLRFEQVANELDAIRRILEPAASRSEVRRHAIQQDGDDRG